MRADSETLTESITSKANWPLALCAGLLGIGQNGLLVMLPQLVTLTGFSLSVWAGLLMFGSMLFLPASPWWGRQSERRGCKVVMVASLSGYLASFGVMALVVWAMAAGRLESTWGLAGLILSRLLYGLTVSGMVPAAQTWAIQRTGLDKRMAALATISSGLSCGRLLGPPLAALMLSVNPVAPLWLMAIAPLIALLLVLREVADPPLPPVAHQATRLQMSMLPFLLLAMLLAALVSLMQLGLSPHLSPLLDGNARDISHHVALLLSLAALATLAAQFLVVRPQHFSPLTLLCMAAVLMVAGLALMCIAELALFYVGIAITSLGAAMATPGYQLLLNDRLTTGKGAGAIATSHTLGYGVSALLVPVVTRFFGEHYLTTAAFGMAALFLALSIGVRLTERTHVEKN
ncbi:MULTISPECIES: MFS transporter [unclassified Enterobacter cloacae complex]|uniref:MFS transporter n=1 Tax=unclassified Enterobacter cloacae complex TaxID=2757714 RepID=UPI00187255FE|nr:MULTISPECIES: MFS transporter [unclassified Enterobacter cloacae complex]MBE4811202.1 MFS transporter [Enterobacter cloacae complex sp. P44RS]MBE4829996.1 MFS transporter [Enterobacter cloacae complex sp. P42RS]MBE4837305.1 MFS transporter [Enterobacter cloacae complex sp. P46RS]MBE4843272.1 MFS transporter [Enterobacter cloacae complex sp. P42C]